MFDLLVSSNVIQRIIGLMGANTLPLLLWEVTKVITYFGPGPRVAHTPKDSQFHPDKMVHKGILINNGVLQKLIELISSSCSEVAEQSILAIGFLCRHDKEVRDLTVAFGIIEKLIPFLNENSPIKILENTSWTLSIISGASYRESKISQEGNVL
jgi:hypothetical protein